jgi:hypothetical protein
MLPGNVFQTSEFDSEILRSGEFQLISVTLDATATYGGAVKIPKGTLLVTSTDLSDGTYEVLSTAANHLASTITQYMKDVVVLSETILDASAGDQPVKAYWAGTFDLAKLKYDNLSSTAITKAQWMDVQRLKVVGLPSS